MMFKSNRKLTSLVLLPALLVMLVSCRAYLHAYTEEKINGFAASANSAVVKYNGEPVFGEADPFPASFVITGKVIFIEEQDGYFLPDQIYGDASAKDSRWFSKDPDLVRYVVLIERTSGDRYTFTITDLGYNEQVYKGISDSIQAIEETIDGLIL